MPRTNIRANPKLVRLVRESVERGEVASITARNGLREETVNGFALGKSPTMKTVLLLSDWAADVHPDYLIALDDLEPCAEHADG